MRIHKATVEKITELNWKLDWNLQLVTDDVKRKYLSTLFL